MLLVVAYFALDPTPPKKVVLATGPEQSAYAEFGKRYAEALKRRGITVELRNTQGAAENLRLLLDPASGVDLAFVQGGAGEKARAQAETDALVSLGSLFYEPVWLFYRGDAAQRLLKADTLTSLSQLTGWRVNIGARGSGSPGIVRKVRADVPTHREVRELYSVLDSAPIVNEKQLELWDRISAHYLCTHGETMIAAVPGPLVRTTRGY